MASGVCVVDVGRHFGLPPAIYKNAEQICESAKRAAQLTTKLIMKQRGSCMEKMERMWSEDLSRMRTPVSQAIIQQKAKSLYDDLKKESKSSVSTAMARETFTTSRG